MSSHESEALEGKQKLRMKTFSELAECLAQIAPKITLYGCLFKYNDMASLLLLMFSTDLLFVISISHFVIVISLISDLQKSPQKLKKNKKEK